MNPESFFPSIFSRMDFQELTIPGHSVDYLHIEQMNMDGVSVHTIMGDLPDLSAIFQRSELSGIEIAWLEKLCGRSQVRIQDKVLLTRHCERQFQSEEAAHATVFIKGFAHLILNGFILHPDRDRIGGRSRPSAVANNGYSWLGRVIRAGIGQD